MKNVIIYIIGFTGVGKYTIAKEIAAQENFRLVDNHLINMPVFSLVHLDSKTLLPPRIWKNIADIWNAVLDTIVHISPHDYNFVLTNALFEDPEQRAWYEKIEAMAEERGATFIPVRLSCSVEENTKRIVTPERKERLKETNPESPARNATEHQVLKIAHKNLIELDVTSISAQDAAKKIISHAKLKSGS